MELLGEATDLLLRCGWAATTAGRIATAAGVSRSAVLFHFPDRTALAVALLQAGTEAWVRTIRDVRPLTPLTTPLTVALAVANAVAASSDPTARAVAPLVRCPAEGLAATERERAAGRRADAVRVLLGPAPSPASDHPDHPGRPIAPAAPLGGHAAALLVLVDGLLLAGGARGARAVGEVLGVPV